LVVATGECCSSTNSFISNVDDMKKQQMNFHINAQLKKEIKKKKENVTNAKKLFISFFYSVQRARNPNLLTTTTSCCLRHNTIKVMSK
jgi:hypothetical protein